MKVEINLEQIYEECYIGFEPDLIRLQVYIGDEVVLSGECPIGFALLVSHILRNEKIKKLTYKSNLEEIVLYETKKDPKLRKIGVMSVNEIYHKYWIGWNWEAKYFDDKPSIRKERPFSTFPSLFILCAYYGKDKGGIRCKLCEVYKKQGCGCFNEGSYYDKWEKTDSPRERAIYALLMRNAVKKKLELTPSMIRDQAEIRLKEKGFTDVIEEVERIERRG